MHDELRFHLERQIAANISAGMAPEEARRQAVLQLGAMEGVKENCREQRRGFWLESFYADVRYGLPHLAQKSRLHVRSRFSRSHSASAQIRPSSAWCKAYSWLHYHTASPNGWSWSGNTIRR